MDEAFLDGAAWQRMLAQEGDGGASAHGGGVAVGLLRRQDYRTRSGTLLVWEQGAGGLRAAYRPYLGVAPEDLGLLLVADAADLVRLCQQGLASLALMIRQRRFDPYMLKTMDELETAGLAEFVEDLGLNFPVH